MWIFQNLCTIRKQQLNRIHNQLNAKKSLESRNTSETFFVLKILLPLNNIVTKSK